MVATAGIVLGTLGGIVSIRMASITRLDENGKKLSMLPRVKKVVIILFVGCLAFIGAVLFDILTSSAQPILLVVGGLLYLGAGIYHIYATRQEEKDIKWFVDTDFCVVPRGSLGSSTDNLEKVGYGDKLDKDAPYKDAPSLYLSPVERRG